MNKEKKKYRYAIFYKYVDETFTYTSCKYFRNQQHAVNAFPFKSATVLFTLKIKNLLEKTSL